MFSKLPADFKLKKGFSNILHCIDPDCDCKNKLETYTYLDKHIGIDEDTTGKHYKEFVDNGLFIKTENKKKVFDTKALIENVVIPFVKDGVIHTTLQSDVPPPDVYYKIFQNRQFDGSYGCKLSYLVTQCFQARQI